MRLVTLVSAAALLAAATPAMAQDADTNGILKSLMPKVQDAPLNADGSVAADKTRGIKRMSAPPAAVSATVSAAAPDKPAASLLVLFGSGSAELTASGRALLDKLGAAMKNPHIASAHFRIEGHTDTTGDDQTNQALSERRANAVVEYLVTRCGIDRDRLATIGMGKQGLAVNTPDQTPELRNRRVVVVNLDG